MENRLFKPFITLVVVLSLAVLALVFTVGVKFDFVPGVIMELPVEAGSWVGNELRFCHNPDLCAKDFKDTSFYVRDLEIPDICPDCGEHLFKMARAEKEALPEDTEFVKSAYTNDTGGNVFTSIVLSGTARDSIHRPQRCLKGQGNTLDGEYDLTIPMEGRKDLTIRVILATRMIRTAEGKVPYYSYYAYWFVGQDHETQSHYVRMFWLAWDRVVHSKANRWAYIAVQGRREAEGNEFEQDVIDFVQNTYPDMLTDAMRDSVYK